MTKREPDIGNLLEAYVTARIRWAKSTTSSEIAAWQEIADARREILFDAISKAAELREAEKLREVKQAAALGMGYGTAAARVADDERHAQQTER